MTAGVSGSPGRGLGALTDPARIETVHAAVEEYDSRFAGWDRRASVRTKPMRALEPMEPGAVYFSPELVPPAGHWLVRRRGVETVDRLLIHRLYQYLRFTSELEDAAVIPVAMDISRGRSGLRLPDGMRADAFKIVTDEAWHAQFSYELRVRVEQRTGVRCDLPATVPFVDRLERVRHGLDPEVRGPASLLFATVSETLISAILADLPHDRRLPSAVRNAVSDHAEDEGRHHAYFRALLKYLWPALSRRQRRLVGPMIPEMIFAFLEPDYCALSYSLRDLGFSGAEIQQIVEESLPRELVRREVAAGATTTLRYLREVGVLDDPATAAAFTESGLIATGSADR